MFRESIDQFLYKKQVLEIHHNKIYDIKLYRGKIYCPMCEDMHENNTLCQMNQGGF